MKKTYTGSCHCGAVRYEADLDLEAGTGRCNCSICTKKRAWGIGGKPADFRLLSGADSLGRYSFNSHSANHRFCTTCGIHTHNEGHIKEMGGDFVSVSVNTLDLSPEEMAAAPIRYMDGRDNNWREEPKVTSYL